MRVKAKHLLLVIIVFILTSPVLGYSWNIINTSIAASPGPVSLYFNLQSLALNNTGYPAISYSNGTTDDLWYLYYNGTSWINEKIADTGIAGYTSSIVFDPANDFPNIAYYNESGTASLWNISYDGSVWGAMLTNQSDALEPSMVIDPTTGFPSVAFSTLSDLRYSYWDGLDWHTTGVDTVGLVGNHPSLDFNQTSYPSIAYYDETNRNLKIANYTGVAWRNCTIDSVGDVGRNPSLVVNSTDNETIAYFDVTNTALKYAEPDGVGGWALTTVDNSGDTGYMPGMIIDSSDYPHIVYHEKVAAPIYYKVKHAWKDAGGWQNEDIDTYALVPRIANDTYGNIFVSYYRSLGGAERYLHIAYTLTSPATLPDEIIYGQVFNDYTGLPVNGATVNIRNSSWSDTNTTFSYGFIDGVYWFDNLAASADYHLNATKVTYP